MTSNTYAALGGSFVMRDVQPSMNEVFDVHFQPRQRQVTMSDTERCWNVSLWQAFRVHSPRQIGANQRRTLTPMSRSLRCGVFDSREAGMRSTLARRELLERAVGAIT